MALDGTVSSSRQVGGAEVSGKSNASLTKSAPADDAKAGSAMVKELLVADLGFHGADGRYATHAWHPFPAKFPPQLPAYFIDALTEKGEVVFDPMHGSGTTLVEAQRLGRYPIGCDIDPLARLIASAKLAPVPGLKALEVGRGIVQRACQHFEKDKVGLDSELDDRFDEKSREFVDYWFTQDTQLQLLALLLEVETLDDPDLRRFFEVVFSSTIIAKSGGVSLARDLAHTRPHRAKDKKPRSAFTEFEKRLKNNLVDR
ncbi:MAG: site-specific DNA-methyltransferase, partial [Gammaproteobacteria bacterium]|nr:site-specific DNA-methyltransferase [Gammaproteobacteria bacterium]